MDIVSAPFLILLFVTFALFFAVPKRFQWYLLLIASITFYASLGLKQGAFVLLTATTVYVANLLIEGCEKGSWVRKLIFWFTLILNIVILFSFKLFDRPFGLIMPLGISFYTFQSLGYMIEVYWGSVKPEHNYLKSLLFTCFFPQMTQGPISDFKSLSAELFKEHNFSYDNFSQGFIRMLWGFGKKLLLADYLGVYLRDMFGRYDEYSGLSGICFIALYAVLTYADFSGYMDIMCGFCRMLDIKLTENFDRPYFSRDVSEYWRKWHMSMGTWFKKYIYYPVATAKPTLAIGKATKKAFGRKVSGLITATIALLATWFATGIWHQTNLAYIIWGLSNGLLIIISLWLRPVYDKVDKKLHINTESKPWKLFQIVRTFLIISFIKVLPDTGTLANGLSFVTRPFRPGFFPDRVSLSALLPDLGNWEFWYVGFIVIALMFVIDLLKGRKPIEEYIKKIPKPVRIILIALFIVFILTFGAINAKEGFLYAEF